MELKDITVSLDLAKQLKEAGYPQESLFYWKTSTNVSVLTESDTAELVSKETNTSDKWFHFYAAPTASEIGEKLIECSEKAFYRAYGEAFFVPGTSFITPLGVKYILTKPEMLAKMYLYLKSNNLLKD